MLKRLAPEHLVRALLRAAASNSKEAAELMRELMRAVIESSGEAPGHQPEASLAPPTLSPSTTARPTATGAASGLAAVAKKKKGRKGSDTTKKHGATLDLSLRGSVAHRAARTTGGHREVTCRSDELRDAADHVWEQDETRGPLRALREEGESAADDEG